MTHANRDSAYGGRQNSRGTRYAARLASPMLRRALLALPMVPAAIVLAAGVARAQTVALAFPNPTRTINGSTQNDATYQKRLNNQLNATGISFADCEQDLELTFSLALTGFTGGTNLEVWVGPQNCPDTAPRGIGTTAPSCWRLSTPTAPLSTTTNSYSVSFFARDITRYVSTPSTSLFASYDPRFHDSSTGEAACHTQPSEVAITETIYFIPVDPSTQNAVGTALSYKMTVDMVGPPAPGILPLAVGDTLLQVNWASRADPNIEGFQIFIDPPRGQEGAGKGAAAQQDAQTITVCPEAATPPPADASGDGAAEASVDASPVDAGGDACYTETVPAPSGGGGSAACGSAALSGSNSTIVDAGAVAAGEAGSDDGGGTVLSGGGVSQIDPKYLVAQIDDPAATSATITGLQNGFTYTIAVAAVDRSLNVGPVSSEVCDFPAPVDDFWKKYRDAGGQAGGGFCALEAVGTPVGSWVAVVSCAAAALALARRRRSR